jgi:ribosomal protein S18 acetylase RimI-like enzyme
LIEIRSATEDDAGTLLDLAMQAFAEFRDTIVPPPGVLAESVDIVRRAIREHGGILATDNGIRVGSARFELHPGYLYIGRLAVPPQWRGRGIGREMMSFLESHAMTLGLCEARVEVRMALPGNVAMFEAFGYVPLSYQPHPRVPEAMTVIMAKRLAEPAPE